ncbi:HPr(Ser) kinase/phosphatase [Macrococcus armenti]|uniref:HPr(Ser) kinase/phosphatase n=1 Tax=Macrococcus armenti TaxID=2875764 RepID=UPI001CCA2004|nr:HPr(Ser) kinase/phosphatase [Macrococcus armenti]UBH15952.1 HPr(Ser) kinase/phosphatase [Macrococcus armenti]UBH18313.1 HPr(Ser) kinase/phosphatase [Macrococcus armenti]UBH20579.1 HPr(Ser) kinase/phosphatase [Macrococcus armenti]
MITSIELIDKFDLKFLAGNVAIEIPVANADISRPGLEMAGFFSHYSSDRIQILGTTEMSFFETLSKEERSERMVKLCRNETPCIILSRNIPAPQELIDACNRKGTPLLQSKEATTSLISKITSYLESELAPETTMHGVLVDVYGVGVLITGDSGVGKSETALELVKRGHRLVADDNVEIKEVSRNILMGKAPKLIEHLLEIRGLGIINVMTLFGAGSVLPEKRLMLNINLEIWGKDKVYDRIGLIEEKLTILDSEITKKTVPVRPGRNLAVIIEVAAMNYRLNKMGTNTAKDFNDRLNEQIRKQSIKEI